MKTYQLVITIENISNEPSGQEVRTLVLEALETKFATKPVEVELDHVWDEETGKHLDCC